MHEKVTSVYRLFNMGFQIIKNYIDLAKVYNNLHQYSWPVFFVFFVFLIFPSENFSVAWYLAHTASPRFCTWQNSCELGRPQISN